MRFITASLLLLPSLALATSPTTESDAIVSEGIKLYAIEGASLPRPIRHDIDLDTTPNPALSSLAETDISAPEDVVVRLITIIPLPSPIEYNTDTDTIATPTPSLTHLNDLELRQAVGAAGGTVAAPVAATQMPPVSTYLIHGINGQQTPYVYTQTFVKVPDQWPAPTTGTIGLGTISGNVGVVKTNTKRSVWQTAEAVVRRAVVERRSTNDAMHTVRGENGRGLWVTLGCAVGILGVIGVL